MSGSEAKCMKVFLCSIELLDEWKESNRDMYEQIAIRNSGTCIDDVYLFVSPSVNILIFAGISRKLLVVFSTL